MIRCILFGNMCSGKTSVGRLLAHGRSYAIVSAKDAIASNLASATDEVKNLRSRGYLLPDSIITTWVLGAVAERVAKGEQVIVDGFPRTDVQARALIEAYGTASRVVHCDVPQAVIERRFASRIMCSECDMPTSKEFEDFDGRCVLCHGASFAPRPTDKPDYLEVKTRQFQAESIKVLPVLRAAGMQFLSVPDHTRLADLRVTVDALAHQLEGANGH